MNQAERPRWVIEQARKLGFDLCGIAPAEDFPELARLPEWLSRGYAGEMLYLHDARRASPARVLEGARSLIVCALNYNTPLPYSTEVPPGSAPPTESWAEADQLSSGVEGQGETCPERSRGSPDMNAARKSGALAPEDEGASSGGQGFSPDMKPERKEGPLAPEDEGASPGGQGSTGGQGLSPDFTGSGRVGASAPEAEAGSRGWISRYAWGDDYHDVLLEKLDALIAALREQIAEPFEARAYVDTGPVVERAAAYRAGLGWLAKNTCLINPELGSWLFLGVIVTTLELAPSLGPADGSASLTTSAPPPDLCGNCRLCIDACPTGAIVEPYVLDARRCISYLTIELRGAIPEELRAPMGRMVFGCDICQDVCPWNRTAPVSPLATFLPRTFSHVAGQEQRPGTRHSSPATRHSLLATSHSSLATRHSLFGPSLEWLASLSEDDFRRIFRGSAIKRTKWRGLVRNACVALGNSGVRPDTPAHARIVALLERLNESPDSVVAEHAAWALRQLCQ